MDKEKKLLKCGYPTVWGPMSHMVVEEECAMNFHFHHYYIISSSNAHLLAQVFLNKVKQKWKGGQSGTYLRLTIGVVGSAGERRKT